MLLLKFNFVETHVTVSCHGRIVWGREGALLRAVLFDWDCDHLTLDLAGVDSIDAHGLGALVTIARWAKRNKVCFSLSNPNSRVDRLVRMFNLDRIIQVIATEGAMRSSLPECEVAIRAGQQNCLDGRTCYRPIKESLGENRGDA